MGRKVFTSNFISQSVSLPLLSLICELWYGFIHLNSWLHITKLGGNLCKYFSNVVILVAVTRQSTAWRLVFLGRWITALKSRLSLRTARQWMWELIAPKWASKSVRKWPMLFRELSLRKKELLWWRLCENTIITRVRLIFADAYTYWF